MCACVSHCDFVFGRPQRHHIYRTQHTPSGQLWLIEQSFALIVPCGCVENVRSRGCVSHPKNRQYFLQGRHPPLTHLRSEMVRARVHQRKGKIAIHTPSIAGCCQDLIVARDSKPHNSAFFIGHEDTHSISAFINSDTHNNTQLCKQHSVDPIRRAHVRPGRQSKPESRVPANCPQQWTLTCSCFSVSSLSQSWSSHFGATIVLSSSFPALIIKQQKLANVSLASTQKCSGDDLGREM